MNSPLVGGVNLNIAAASFEVTFFLTLALFATETTMKLKAALLCFALVLIAAVVISGSRSALAGLAGAVSILIYIGMIKKYIHRPELRFGLAFAGMFGGISVSLLLAVYIFHDSAFTCRLQLWKLALGGVIESPLSAILGTGYYGPYYLFRHYIGDISYFLPELEKQPWLLTTHPHSDYMAVLYGSGLTGLLAFLGIIALPFRLAIDDSLQKSRWFYFFFAGLSALAIHGGGDPMSTVFYSGVLFWIFLAGVFSQSGMRNSYFASDGKVWRKGMGIAAGIFLILIAGMMNYEYEKNRILKPVLPLWLQLENHSVKASDLQIIEKLNSSLLNLERFNSQYPFSDVSFFFYSRISTSCLSLRFSNAAERAREEEKIIQSYCRAIRLNDSPLYFYSLSNFMSHRNLRPAAVCGESRAAFEARIRASDPYGLAPLIEKIQ